MDAEKVYLSMIDELTSPLPGIPNVFAPGQPCELLYQQIYDAKGRLCDHLNTDEDADIECIMDNFFELNRELCILMYHLGREHAMHLP